MSKKQDASDDTKTVATLASSENKALALPEDMATRFADSAGAGREDFGAGDFAIPFIAALQTNSPQVDKTDAKYVDGAEPGMLFNTVTGAIYSAFSGAKDETPGIRVVPAAYQKLFVEWVPRTEGGGFVAQHQPDSAAHKSATPDPEKPSKLKLPNGNDLVETAYYYVVIDGEAGPEWAVIAMTSTALKLSRKWNTLIAAKKIRIGGEDKSVPGFGQVYQVNTVKEKNDYGTWFGLTVKGQGVVTEASLFDEAKNYRDAVLSGKVKATAPAQPDSESSGAQSASSGKVPF